jgi:hypothetical protein
LGGRCSEELDVVGGFTNEDFMALESMYQRRQEARTSLAPVELPQEEVKDPVGIVNGETTARDEFSDKIQRAVVNLLTTKDLRDLSAAPQTQRATKAMFGFGLRGDTDGGGGARPTVYHALESKALNVVGRDKAVWALITVSSAPPSSTLDPDDPDTVIDEHGICYQGELDGKRGRKRQRRACFSVRVD